MGALFGRGIYFPLFFILLLPLTQLPAATRNPRYSEDHGTSLSDIRDTVETLRHQVNNHESEIHVFDEKLKNLDAIIDSVRDQLSDATKNQKELLKGNTANLETKISTLETTSKSLVSDLRQFQTHANESATALAQYKQKISELEKIIHQQNQDIENLQSAIHSLMDLIQGKNTSPKTSTASIETRNEGNTYCVKTGDNLEKIARAHQTTIQALKDLNGLTNDRIVVGKLLKIPPPPTK